MPKEPDATPTMAPMTAVELHTVHDALDQNGLWIRRSDAIPQIVWTNNTEGTTTYFNRRWYEYTGLNFAHSPDVLLVCRVDKFPSLLI